MTKRITVPMIEKRLDVLLRAVRYSGTADGITNKCATCQGVFPIKELQCGHFIKRGNQRLKYVSINLMPQCRRCNHFLDGAQDKAAHYIIHKYGLDDFDILIENDRKWLASKKTHLKREDLVVFYNYWLRHNRYIENKWHVQLIPKTWKPIS